MTRKQLSVEIYKLGNFKNKTEKEVVKALLFWAGAIPPQNKTELISWYDNLKNEKKGGC